MGSHTVTFYESDTALVHALGAYVSSALRSGDTAVVVATPEHRAGLEAYLRDDDLVYRPDGSRVIYLTFEGLRESRTVADKRTRIRITLPVSEATRLRELLDESNL